MRSLPKSKHKGSGGISNVLVPIPTTKRELLWESVTNAPDIERFVLDRNIHHFSSAGETQLKITLWTCLALVVTRRFHNKF